ncbi:MAG TPA: GNAT family N-acetyltransferase [Solirubrobacter sp.]|nr:GNAT family N-acetyltransferase [Solirubrobacter sp.]
MPEIRPMREADVPAVHDLNIATFEDLERRRNLPPQPPPDAEKVAVRYRHLLRTDPGGAWVAEHEGELVACALAILREGVWGLSLLVVRPDVQSAGIGRAILAQAAEYANGARGRIILASPDPRALRAYARLGLELHPALGARGKPRLAGTPGGIVTGGVADIPFTEAVDRHVRGAAHGADVGVQLEMGQTLLIAPERGYAVVGGGEVRLLAALDEDGARDLLRAALATAGDGTATVSWLTSAQQWAIGVCLDAGLELRGDSGAVFVDGDVGPFHPYLPSGAFL